MQANEHTFNSDEFPYSPDNAYTSQPDGPAPFKHFIGNEPIYTLELERRPQLHRIDQAWAAWCPTVCGHKLIAYGSNEQHAVNVLVRNWYIIVRKLHEGRIAAIDVAASERLTTGETMHGTLTLWLHEDGTVEGGPFKPLSLTAQALLDALGEIREHAHQRMQLKRALTELSEATSTSDLWEGEEWRFH